jgi:hypothetical protein
MALSKAGLTHSTAPSPAFEGGVKKRRSGSTLSKPQHLCWEVEGLTFKAILFIIILKKTLSAMRRGLPTKVHG